MPISIPRSRPARKFAAKVAASMAITVLAGCAHLSKTSQTTVIDSRPKDACATIDTRNDQAVARVLDINDMMLTALRKFSKTDNAGVCAMSWDERNNVRLAHRKTLKDPNRKALRAPSKEYIRTW
ncbi:MAG: hypothetical protein ACKO15_09260, partial [Burkholderiales bacterium]